MNQNSKMMRTAKIRKRKRYYLFFIFGLIFLISSCVYYNTFYNAQLYYKQGVKAVKNNPTAAKTNFEKSIAKSAVVVKKHFRSKWADDALFLVGMSYYYLAEYEKAIKNFDDLLTVFPNSPYRDEANYYRGLAYLENKDFGQAVVIFSDLKANSARFGLAASYQIAQLFYEKEEYDIAKDSIAAFINRYPKAKETKEAKYALAESYFKLKNWLEAGRWYRNYINQGDIDPKTRAGTEIKLAECLFNQGKYDSVEILLAKDYSRYTDLVNQANLILGKAMLGEKKDEAAIQHLARVRTGEPGAEAYFILGHKNEDIQDLERASALYDTAVRLAPNSEFGSQARKHLSLLNLLQGKNKEVKDSAEAQFMLGEVYGFALNDNESAIREYKKTYNIFPKSPYAPKALFAEAWLIKNRLQGTDYDTVLKTLINQYPRTLYANAARRELGLPEIKLLAEDTASRKPLAESLLMAKTPKSESLTLAKEKISTVPKESLAIIEEKLPIAAKESLALAKEKTVIPQKESLVSEVPPKPESLPIIKPTTPPSQKELLPETGLTNPPPKIVTLGKKPEPTSPPTRGRQRRPKREEVLPSDTFKTTGPKGGEKKPLAKSLAQKEIAIKESTVAVPETITSPKPTLIESTFEPIHFDFDRYNIRSDDAQLLNITVKDLAKDSAAKIILEGYTDPIGTDKYNYGLGLRRANSTKEYLIKLGVKPTRIHIKSLGKEKLVSTDSSEYWKNRRVEIYRQK